MRKIVIVESLTLDGVMQAPVGQTRTCAGGLCTAAGRGPYNDEVMAHEMGKGMGKTELLFGRRTYENFYSFWPIQPEPNPFTEVLNNTQKYVASTTLNEPLPWVNSTLLTGDAAEAVSALKEQQGKDIVVLGSEVLVQSLMRSNLIDEFTLLIHPLVLGSGRRLFPDGSPTGKLRLTDSVTTTTGVVIATYRPAETT